MRKRLITLPLRLARPADLIGDSLAHPSNIEKLKEEAKKQRGEI